MAFELVVVGGSLGGTQALRAVLAALPAEFPLPLAVVLHRSRSDTGLLRNKLSDGQPLTAVDVADKEPLLAGRVYLAPAGYHLLVEFPQPGPDGSSERTLALSTEGPVNWARPAIDVLFETAADVYRERLIGVLLTGSSNDGAAGLARIRECGGLTVVQDPATAEDGTMPAAALAQADHKVLSLAQIGPFLIECVKDQASSRPGKR